MLAVSYTHLDYYQFDEAQYRLVGTATEQVYKLGQRIRVRVAAVDKVGGTIDFVPERSWEEE